MSMPATQRRDTDAGSWGFVEGDTIVPGRTALRHLGTSRTHDVYEAIDEDLLTVVAVKLLRPDRVDDERARAALQHEGELLLELNHPVLPRCFDAATDGARPHLALELIEGPRLSTLIRRQRWLGPEHVVPLAVQLCAAIHHLGRRGLVHLDVKPKNVVMAPSPKLIDLSVAETVERAARLRGPVGTDPYMAPEQCGEDGYGEPGPPADVWGVCATLYEASTGALPFRDGARDGTPVERFPQLAESPRPLPDHVPLELAGMIEAGLSRRPGDRPTAAEIAASLEPAFERLPRRLLLGRVRVRWRS